ncbi:hypothetical protein [Nocardia sp. MW-W600-9]
MAQFPEDPWWPDRECCSSLSGAFPSLTRASALGADTDQVFTEVSASATASCPGYEPPVSSPRADTAL